MVIRSLLFLIVNMVLKNNLEKQSLHYNHVLHADLEGVGQVSDYDYCEYFDGKVININDMETEDNRSASFNTILFF